MKLGSGIRNSLQDTASEVKPRIRNIPTLMWAIKYGHENLVNVIVADPNFARRVTNRASGPEVLGEFSCKSCLEMDHPARCREIVARLNKSECNSHFD